MMTAAAAMRGIDTHVHLWDLSLYSYSWTKAVPLLNRSFRISDYAEAIRGVEISEAVLVEADVDEEHILDEARYLLSLADGDERIRGVVAGSRPEKTIFKRYLDEIAGHPKLKGIRRVLHSQPDDLAESNLFVENIRQLEQYGLTFDICVVERQLPAAIHLVKQSPRVNFVLDHCGGPAVNACANESWREAVRTIARYPNVACKISGLVGYAGHDTWTVEDIRERFDHVASCFGWERLLFGSDWPVCTLSTTPKEWMQVLCAIARDTSESNRQGLFFGNAEYVYKL